MPLPDDPAEKVGWRLAEPGEIPRGATTIINLARKGDWKISVAYSRLPWMNSDGSIKMYDPNKLGDDNDDEPEVDPDADEVVGSETAEVTPADLEVAMAEAIVVYGMQTGHTFMAKWYRKLWTKPGLLEEKYLFSGACIRPGVAGGLWSTKAKKDLHPENIGDATIGGLKNSKTLTAYLKKEA